MRDWYRGKQAHRYNRLWRTFTGRTVTAALEMVDWAPLENTPERLGRAPRALDAACGTGVLLRRMLERLPGLEASGFDASAAMLAQARAALADWPQAQLAQATLGPNGNANLPYAPGTFDLITCTNSLHYLPEPEATLAGLARLLAPGGQLILEDYARREPPFPWGAFEWLVRRLDAQHVRAYTLAEAGALCAGAGLRLRGEQRFTITWLWRGWALCAQAEETEALLPR